MSSSASPPKLEDIQATLSRLDGLVETSQFGDEGERSALRQQLAELRREVGELKEDALPVTLHNALQQAEGLAVRRLVDSSEKGGASDIADLSWEDLGRSIEQAIESWEAQHPRLAVALMNFSEVLSKLGI
tara:strand:- start:126 stop:518 length:393 start_codon:yes stop_codon:yes gene_type:complete